jgi:hypothetical protein
LSLVFEDIVVERKGAELRVKHNSIV